MKIELRIALRYIITKRSFHFISVITILSLIGITVGVAALISVLSIFNGFQNLTKAQFIGFDPHLRIVPEKGAWIDADEKLIEKIRSMPETKQVTKTIGGRIVGINDKELQVFSLVSIPKEDLDFLEGVRKTTIFGNFSIQTSSGFPAMVMGNALADRLRVLPGDTIKLVSPKMIEQSVVGFQRQREVRAVVTGIFNSNIKDYDIMYGFASDTLGKLLLNPKIGHYSTIDIKLHKIENLEYVKSNLHTLTAGISNIKIQSWQDLNPDLFNIMRFERFATFSILSIIIVLAVFNVLVSLSMTVVEKRQDIGILKALGAGRSMIRNIFLWEGIIIGIVSTTIGTALGLFLTWGQINFKWFRIDASKFIIDAIPVAVSTSDVVIVALFSLFLTSIATIYPAFRASSTEVIEAIRTG
ncbi:MAG: ABC transporter permease [Candidatus Kapabacteria bacterium]|nr:ABC transporter permease [Ignavibacteriota bacterium]MCW5883646.1 ABC transporter permease [Candidatus Kapabacteria bacterium]